MSDQWKNRIVIVTTGILLFSFSIACLLKPSDEVSLSERRPLTQFPSPDTGSLLSGSFMEKFDKYAVDQFPMREAFRHLYSTVSLDLLGKSDIEGLYLKDDMAIAIKGNAENIYLSIIPDKNYFLQDDDSALTMDYDDFFQTMQDANPQMHYIDIAPLLELTDYYQTDPHWRQEKIIDVANHLADSMGTFVSDDFQEQVFTNDFRGAYAGQAAQNLSGEPLWFLTSPAIEQCTVFDHQNDRQISMYDFVKGDGKDPYELFLSGSLSYITIENPAVQTDLELVIFRDSFGSAIAPLLATGYQKITLLDVRYLSSYSLPSLIDFKNQDVLFLYSTSVLNHSETLK